MERQFPVYMKLLLAVCVLGCYILWTLTPKNSMISNSLKHIWQEPSLSVKDCNNKTLDQNKINIEELHMMTEKKCNEQFFLNEFTKPTDSHFPFNNNIHFPTERDFICAPKLNMASKNIGNNALVFFVESAPQNKMRREMIRKTWGNQTTTKLLSSVIIEVVYVIGIPQLKHTNSGLIELKKTIQDLHQEIETYHDILLLNLSDHYNHLPHKTQGAMVWLHNNLPSQIRHVFKTDDDSFINTFAWFKILKDLPHQTKPYILGTSIHRNIHPIRRKNHKNYMSLEEYPKSVAPPYCSGSGYLLSRKAMAKLIEGYYSHIVMRNEDMFFTGVIAEEFGIKLLGYGYYKDSPSAKRFLVLHQMPARMDVWESVWKRLKASYRARDDGWSWPNYMPMKILDLFSITWFRPYKVYTVYLG